MSALPDFGFGKFVPGFDFLQNLAKGTQAMPQMAAMSNWVAPTLDVQELDKRIAEMKAVQFWLEQNGKALAATIQALEVQKMTLATLKGMKLDMEEVADSLKARTVEAMAGMQQMGEEALKAQVGDAKKAASQPKAQADDAAAAARPAVDPLQWWGALTQQFQEIAAHAMQDVAQAAPAAKAHGRTGAAAAPKTASRQSAPRKSAPGKSTPRKGTAR